MLTLRSSDCCLAHQACNGKPNKTLHLTHKVWHVFWNSSILLFFGTSAYRAALQLMLWGRITDMFADATNEKSSAARCGACGFHGKVLAFKICMTSWKTFFRYFFRSFYFGILLRRDLYRVLNVKSNMNIAFLFSTVIKEHFHAEKKREREK